MEEKELKMYDLEYLEDEKLIQISSRIIEQNLEAYEELSK